MPFGYVEAVTTTAPSSVAEVQPGNYVRFANLAGSTLSVEFVADGADVIPDADASASRLKFSGFQLVGVLAPVLQVSRLGATQVRLAWPASATGFALKSNVVLDGTWTTVNVSPTREGDQLIVTLPTTGTAADYLLEQP